MVLLLVFMQLTRDLFAIAKFLLETVDDCFLTQHVLEPTRGNAVLDLIFTSVMLLLCPTREIVTTT